MTSPSKPVRTRTLGKDGPKVTAMGFGLMGLSAYYGKTEDVEERLKFLDHVFDTGERFWDTADVYGDSEELVGKWFKKSGRRDDVFLATKFGIHGASGGVRNDAQYIHETCEKSLSLLGVESIDLYYCHRVDSKQPVETTVKAMVELKNQGKIKYLGFSEISAATLRRAHAVHPIHAVQIEYSPFTMDIEDPRIGLLDACRELGVTVVAYSPLGRGFLTGSIKSPDDFEDGDFRKKSPRFSPENFPKNLELVDKIGALAKTKGVTAGQLVLAFLLAQGDDIIPIPGTSKYKNYDENMGALNVDISHEENAEIRKAIASAEVQGGRYPEGWESTLFADTVPLE